MGDSCQSPLFALGRLLITPAAQQAIIRAGQNPVAFLHRHVVGDWGELSLADRQENERAFEHEGDPDRQYRVLSAYRTSQDEKIWIITEWDRSVTTILLPDEY